MDINVKTNKQFFKIFPCSDISKHELDIFNKEWNTLVKLYSERDQFDLLIQVIYVNHNKDFCYNGLYHNKENEQLYYKCDYLFQIGE